MLSILILLILFVVLFGDSITCFDNTLKTIRSNKHFSSLSRGINRVGQLITGVILLPFQLVGSLFAIVFVIGITVVYYFWWLILLVIII